MQIYTSYFGVAKKLPKELIQISICLSPPKGYNGFEYKVIAPNWNILSSWKRNPNIDNYIRAYNFQILNKLNQYTVYHQLEELSGDKDCVLLCYEKPTDFCHRHLFAEWMNTAGYNVKEFQF